MSTTTETEEIDHYDMEERFCFFILAKYGVTVQQEENGFWQICKDGIPIKDTWPLSDEHLKVNCFDGRYEAIPYAFIFALASAREEAIKEAAKIADAEGKQATNRAGGADGRLMALSAERIASRIRSLSHQKDEGKGQE